MISTCSCILCLSFTIMFLVCGDMTTRIFSACGHASLKLRGIVIARMSPKCSINNINIVAKFSETPYLIYKKEQYRSSIYSKMIKYLKTQTLTYLIESNHTNSNNDHSLGLCIFMYTVVINYINILLIAIKTSGQNTDQKLIAGNISIYIMRVLMYMLKIIFEQHNIWWDNTIVGYNNYAHTVSRLTPSYMISIGLALEHSRFEEHVPLMKISYLFHCKQCTLFHHIIICHILYSLVKTMCLVLCITILCYTCIESYPKKFRLSLENGTGILIKIKECNPCLNTIFTFHPSNNQIIVCPVTGMNNYKYDTKGHCDNESRTIAGQNSHALSDITATSALNRTDQSALNNIDPDINYLSTNMKSINTQYYDDQQFRHKFKSNKNISMFHLNIRSIPEHFIELTSYIHSLNIAFKIIGISET